MKALFDLLKRLSDFQYPVFQVEYPVFQVECPDFKFEYSIFRQKSAVIFSPVQEKQKRTGARFYYVFFEILPRLETVIQIQTVEVSGGFSGVIRLNKQ